MTITAAAVKELRDRTGAGMMDCKAALTETGGNLDQAIKILRTKGLAAAAKKAHRAASEGQVVVAGDRRAMVMLELNCETDFVARNPEFQQFVSDLSTQALDSGARNADALKSQSFAGDPSHTVEQMISQKVATIGENIVLSRLARVDAGEGNHLSSYVHGGGKIGVIVEGSEAIPDEALHDVALHVAASEPRFLRREQVTPELLDAEREIAKKQAMDQGKPEHIADRIVEGKMEKFFEQEVLLEQPFVKDTSMSVKQFLAGAADGDAGLAGFVLFKRGESDA